VTCHFGYIVSENIFYIYIYFPILNYDSHWWPSWV
jgi:hypothetical protein